MNDERTTGQIGQLMAMAEHRVSRLMWNGPFSRGEALKAAIQNLDGAAVGLDWTDVIPDDLRDLWDSLSLQAQITSFIVAADYVFSSDGRATCGE